MKYGFQKKQKKPITFYIGELLYEKLNQLAKEQDRSLSNTVVFIVKKYFDDGK